MISIGRVLLVTGGLMATGAVVGTLCAGVAMALLGLLQGEWAVVFDPRMWFIAAMFGAPVGAVAAPLLSWICLRHVPLGRAILHTALGTIGGTVVAAVLATNPIFGALAGFAASGAWLALRTPRRRPRHSSAAESIGRTLEGS